MELCQWKLQITITKAAGALIIFFQSGVEKLLSRLGIESTTLDLSSQSQPRRPLLSIRLEHIIGFLKSLINRSVYGVFQEKADEWIAELDKCTENQILLKIRK